MLTNPEQFVSSMNVELLLYSFVEFIFYITLCFLFYFLIYQLKLSIRNENEWR
ncbi:hypothetical protein A6A12_0755 [Vibrio anguillarum]|nr:hypothetical protein A6A12_0755 [Vibrio anguillarum]